MKTIKFLLIFSSLSISLMAVDMEAFSPEETEIFNIIELQNKGWLEAKFEYEEQAWAHVPYAMKIGQSGSYSVGWDEISERYKSRLNRSPFDAKYLYSNFHFKIEDDIAWVTHEQAYVKENQKLTNATGWESRILEKIDGKWKIVYHASRFIKNDAKGDYQERLQRSYDKPPVPQDGMEAVREKVVFPEDARKAKMQGNVFVDVTIDEVGNVVEVQLLKGICTDIVEHESGNKSKVERCSEDYGCNAAAMAAVASVKWKPAIRKGKPVLAKVTVPVAFKLK